MTWVRLKPAFETVTNSPGFSSKSLTKLFMSKLTVSDEKAKVEPAGSWPAHSGFIPSGSLKAKKSPSPVIPVTENAPSKLSMTLRTAETKSLPCLSPRSSLWHTRSESHPYWKSWKFSVISFLSGKVLTMLPLKESASFSPFSQAVTG